MRRLLIVLVSLILPLHSAWTKTPEEQGLEIAIEADKRDNGWVDQQAQMRMILRNKQGDESIRQIRSRTLEVPDDGDKSLTIFDEPADVKGTAFLSFTHSTEPDDQWLYLPALKRVKRISSANKSGPFMGSEFAYEDITSQEVDKYTYKFLRDEELNGMQCFVIERYPEYKKSGYSKQVVWIDHEHYRAQKIEYYDRKGDLLKTMMWKGYEQYLDKYWRATEMHMENHVTGKSTVLEWSDYALNTGISTADFNKNSLKRLR